MDKKLYDMMDWAGIEELVYSEAAEPRQLLGPHVTEDGILIQAYIPTAAQIIVKTAKGKEYPMEFQELQDGNGVFAVLVPGKRIPDYTLRITYDGGMSAEIHDPYAFDSQYTDTDLKKFAEGIHYEIYRKMGAHPMELKGVKGVNFSVWAPCAVRVSVVGDFNSWDGRRHQMQRLGDSGIFELFIPELEAGAVYKYEIKNRKGEPMMKSDPYGNYAELRPNTASVVWDISQYQWQDEKWMAAREKTGTKAGPVSIYEMHLGSWIRKPISVDEDGREIVGSEFYNYREIAPRLAEYIKEMGYTHVELMPVMEHPLDASWGYQVTGYYAPTSRYGTPDDFMYFMDYMHGQGIGVILDWVPAHFPRDSYGLAAFDGTCVYEHQDPRQGSHPHWGTLIYNYGRPQVSNFLIANALFWAKQYHADGIRMDAVASMLYLDYGKNDGEWVANIYGGHENLEAVEFLKHLNSVFKGQTRGALLIAEESTAWPQITGAVKDNGLGFDYKWNMGWMNDFTSYMQCDPYFRNHNYGKLTFSMLYAYSEDFVLVFSHDEVVHGKYSMLCKMPGENYEAKANNLRAAYGYMYGHPGKKLLFMGQEFAQVSEWNENEELPWGILEYPVHKTTQEYVKALNKLYRTQPALSQKDFHPDGFQWINCSLSSENMVIFQRKTDKPEETLLFVSNFAPVEHKNYQIGVPFYGKYKEILNSDAEIYGGSGAGNPRVKTSRQEEWDERPNSIVIDVPPMSTIIFSCTPMPEPVKKEAKSAKDTKAAKETKAVKGTKTAKAGKVSETAREEKAGKGSGTAKVEKVEKVSKTAKEEKAEQASRAAKPEDKPAAAEAVAGLNPPEAPTKPAARRGRPPKKKEPEAEVVAAEKAAPIEVTAVEDSTAEPAVAKEKRVTESVGAKAEKASEPAGTEASKVAEPVGAKAGNVPEPVEAEKGEKATEPVEAKAESVPEPVAAKAAEVTESVEAKAENVSEPKEVKTAEAVKAAESKVTEGKKEAEPVTEGAVKTATGGAEGTEKTAEPVAAEAEKETTPEPPKAEAVPAPRRTRRKAMVTEADEEPVSVKTESLTPAKKASTRKKTAKEPTEKAETSTRKKSVKEAADKADTSAKKKAAKAQSAKAETPAKKKTAKEPAARPETATRKKAVEKKDSEKKDTTKKAAAGKGKGTGKKTASKKAE